MATELSSKVEVCSTQYFENGSLIEVIRTDNVLRLLEWDGKRATDRATFVREGKRFVPPSNLGDTKFLVLPSGAANSQSASQLLADLAEVISEYFEGETNSMLWGAFVISTWFAELLEVAPLLSIIGGTEECMRALQIMRCVCRRGIVLEQSTANQLCALDRRFQFTLLLDQPNVTPKFAGILRAVTQRGVHPIIFGRPVEIFGPAVIVGGGLEDLDLCSSLELHLSAAKPKGLNFKRKEELIAEFQNRFLSYRLENYEMVAREQRSIDHSGIDIVHSVASCVVEQELQKRIRITLENNIRYVRSQKPETLEELVIEALLVLCHRRENRVYVAQIAQAVETLVEARGERLKLGPRPVGTTLKRLQFHTERLDRNGRGIRLLPGIVEEIHRLAIRHSSLLLNITQEDCRICSKLRDATLAGMKPEV